MRDLGGTAQIRPQGPSFLALLLALAAVPFGCSCRAGGASSMERDRSSAGSQGREPLDARDRAGRASPGGQVERSGPRSSDLATACAPSGAACFSRAEARAEREPARAEADLAECVACTDAPPSAFRLLATLLSDRGARGEARDALRLGVKRHPGNEALWRALARLELALGRPREGLSAMAEAQRHAPNDPDLEREYRDALTRYGTEEDKAEAAVYALLLEATGRVEIDDYKGAQEILGVALQRAAKVPRLQALVHHRLAVLFVRWRDPKDALSELEKVFLFETKPTPLRVEALVTSSEVLLTLGQLRQAVDAAEEAIRIEPRNVLAHANLAIARSMQDDREGAIAALREAFDLGLSRRLTLAEFLAIGPAIDKLKNHPEFVGMIRRAWPKAPYPPERNP